MSAIQEGGQMFQAAVRVSLQHGEYAIRSAWMFIVLYLVLAFAVVLLALPEPLASILVFAESIALLFMIAALAIPIHRAVLLPADDIAIGRDERTAILKSYAWRWFLVFLCLFLIVFALMILWIEVVQGGPENFTPDAGLEPDFLVQQITVPAFSVVFMYVFYRLTLGLPRLACGKGWMGWRGSWAASRPMTWPLLVMCGYAGLLLMASSIVTVLLGKSTPIVVQTVVSFMIMVVSSIVSPAMLNQLYQKVMAD